MSLFDDRHFKKQLRRYSRRTSDIIINSVLGLVVVGILLWGVIAGVTAILRSNDPPEMLDPDTIIGANGAIDAGNNGVNYPDPLDLETVELGAVLYQHPVANLVFHNFPDFESAAELENDLLLSFALWQTTNDVRYAAGVTLEETEFTVTEAAVEQALADSFGSALSGVEIEHHDVEVLVAFSYSRWDNTYTVPSYGAENATVGRLVQKSRAGELYTLTLEYVDAALQAEYELGSGERPAALKTVQLVLSGTAGDYEIRSLKTLS